MHRGGCQASRMYIGIYTVYVYTYFLLTIYIYTLYIYIPYILYRLYSLYSIADLNAARAVEPRTKIQKFWASWVLGSWGPGALKFNFLMQISMQPGLRNQDPRFNSPGIFVFGSTGLVHSISSMLVSMQTGRQEPYNYCWYHARYRILIAIIRRRRS